MSNKTSIWYRLRRLYIIVIWASVLLSIVIGACSTDGIRNSSRAGVTPVNCENCVDLQVRINKQFYPHKEPITVTAKLMLLKEDQIRFTYQGTPIQNFPISLVDEHGLPVALTDQGNKDMYDISIRLVDQLTPRRPFFEETFQINSWFDLSKSGTYTLTVEKRVWVDDKAIDLVSNPVVFTLLP